jgi:hypothetical protein
MQHRLGRMSAEWHRQLFESVQQGHDKGFFFVSTIENISKTTNVMFPRRPNS